MNFIGGALQTWTIEHTVIAPTGSLSLGSNSTIPFLPHCPMVLHPNDVRTSGNMNESIELIIAVFIVKWLQRE